jgi:hypothetical protein
LPERDVTSDSGYGTEMDDVLFTARVDPRGGIALLFREHAPDLATDNFHIRYVSREGDASRVSKAFVGGPGLLTTDFDFHPSGGLTACAYQRHIVMGVGTTYSLQAMRFDPAGTVVATKLVVDGPALSTGGTCSVVTDGEDALIISEASTGSGPVGRVDRLTAAGDVVHVSDSRIECLPPALGLISAGPLTARSSTSTVWSVRGCEIDPTTGKTITPPDDKTNLIAIARGFDGKPYRVRSDGGAAFVDALPASGAATKILDDDKPLNDPNAAELRTSFLLTAAGWTMPEANLLENLGFRHAATLGGIDERVELVGPLHLFSSLVGGDRELYVIGSLGSSGAIGNVKLVHPGGQVAPFFVGRFQDWASVMAAHDAK